MKIGIFGDSFAIGSTVTEDICWYNILGKMLEAEKVVTYGLGATPLLYSYENFKDYHKFFDLNIFLVTHWERYTKSFVLSCARSEQQWASSYNQIDNLKRRFEGQLSPVDRQYLERLQQWFFASDEKFLKIAQDLIVRDILRISNNVIIIPVFHKDFSLTEDFRREHNLPSSCWDFIETQRRSLGIPEKEAHRWYERPDKIACHWTKETNQAFAQAVYNRIKTGDPVVAPGIIQHNNTAEYYFNYE